MVHRLHIEKKPGFRQEAEALAEEIRSFVGIEALTELRLLYRYDLEGVEPDVLRQSIYAVFANPAVEDVYDELPLSDKPTVFATELLPGQFDQRADSASQCIQMITDGDRPIARTAKIYLLYGELGDSELAAITKHLMNPVESREASLAPCDTLVAPADPPESVEIMTGFIKLNREDLRIFLEDYALAMDLNDLALCQEYFQTEGRDPTLVELRMLDTYWSDHCRHTTFLTQIDGIEIREPAAQRAYDRFLKIRAEMNRDIPVTLMELATIGARYLRYKGILTDEEQSDEVNACSVHIDVDVEGETEKWLLMFKNETHNHPTEIEPFGGAATCVGGAIRDPLSGRGYVYQAMRITGAADPLRPIRKTLKGKLPQRKLTTTAAAGYSSYANQIGVTSGLLDEIYHDGYAAKRMELGAVLAAAPLGNVRREEPQPGDQIVLLGGRTGRDGCGGATGSSKSHDLTSVQKHGSEVQRGNPNEEHKLQRLFRDPEASLLIKRCNDFGAGGVSVAIGELADGLHINLNRVPVKYEGLSALELAISESQERMAVVLAPQDVGRFMELAHNENLEATVVAEVTASPRLVMEYDGDVVVDIAREFLNTNGARKYADALVVSGSPCYNEGEGAFEDRFKTLITDLNVCSKRGLMERFDSTIGAGTVLAPLGGMHQMTAAQAMVAKIPVLSRETNTCSAMGWGYNPFLMEKSPYHGAYLAVIDSLSKLVAVGAGIENAHLTFQEYFERLGTEPERWGKSFAALLGALDAQLDMQIGSVGGKDSMSGSFDALDVPPTLVSFAVSTGRADRIVSPEFKAPGSRVVLLRPNYDNWGLPEPGSLNRVYAQVMELVNTRQIRAAYAVGYGGVAEAVFKMALGNRIGFAFATDWTADQLFEHQYGAFVLELGDEAADAGELLGHTTEQYVLTHGGLACSLADLSDAYEEKLKSVFPTEANTKQEGAKFNNASAVGSRYPRSSSLGKIAKPRVLIPVFPSVNGDYDAAFAFSRAGAEPIHLVIRNKRPSDIAESVARFIEEVDRAQILLFPGAYSGGDEPDGAAKFITAFFTNPAAVEAVQRLLEKHDGLIGGIGNGFQALLKLGMLPFGKFTEPSVDSPTLTANTINRHQSKLVRTRVVNNRSPWLMHAEVGDIHLAPVSQGEGRFVCGDSLYRQLEARGQIATQYVDLSGNPSMDISANPVGSFYAVEGITSPDGRIFGKVAQNERYGEHLHKNVPGADGSCIFQGAVDYFR